MNTRAVRNDVHNILDYLQTAELALLTNPVTIRGGLITWVRKSDIPFIDFREPPTVKTYRQWIENGDYSALLSDGSLIQTSYELDGHSLVKHRLAYVPCPVAVEPELLTSDMPVLDVVDMVLQGHPDEIRLYAAIRFDFDKNAASSDHPASHFTFNSQECRIPCSAPMHVGRFMNFVFKNFYLDLWRVHRNYFSKIAHREITRTPLDADQCLHPYIHWNARSPIASHS